jgi:hypothetical protein
VSPRTADAIRKGCAYALAIALTLLIFRVLGRVSSGTQRLLDVELFGAILLGALGVVWIRAAKRVRRAPGAQAGTPPADSRDQ